MIPIANRLHITNEYYFSTKLKEVHTLEAQGKPIINIGIGSPDLRPPHEVVETLENALTSSKVHQYQSYIGLPELRKAMSKFYKKHFNVSLNPDNEILPLMGSKEGVFHISMAFLNPGDHVLIPNPGYPTYEAVSKLVQAIPIKYDLCEENNWLPDFSKLEKHDLDKVKIMFVNYPHMPTGAVATESFFKKLVAFAKEHKILLVNDNPYSFILNDTLISLLKTKGAKDIAIELNSISKTFNMSGWRVGMVLGNEQYLQAILKVKSNMDSGMFYGIQKGAESALLLDGKWLLKLNEIYRKRRELVWELAKKLNCTFSKNTSGLFVWAKIPNGISSEMFTDNLLYKKDIFIAPGTVFGENGEGYVRFSICVSEEKIKEAIERIN